MVKVDSTVKIAGRGATGNATSSRFHLPERQADGNWLDERAVIDGEPPPLRTTVTVLTARTILTRNSSPDVPFSQSINAYGGCDHPHTVVHGHHARCSALRTGSSLA